MDGSVNRLGGAHPHYVEVYQALAKSTSQKEGDLVWQTIYLYFDEEEDSLVDEKLLVIEEMKSWPPLS